MSSQINFDYMGTTYTLEFSRTTAVQTEKTFGVSINDLQTFRLTTFESLFHGALLLHHPRIKKSTVDKLLELISDKPGLYSELVTMFFETCETALDDSANEGEAISWRKA